MSHFSTNNMNSISSANELEAFIGKIITIHGFGSEQSIDAELISTSFDHIKIRIQDGKYEGVIVNLDLRIKGDSLPSIMYISCEGEDMYLHEGDIAQTEIFSIGDEIAKSIKDLLKTHELGILGTREVVEDLKKRGITSSRIIREVSRNQTLAGTIINLLRDDA